MAENRDLTSARSYLGAGWAFPMRTDGRGRIALVSEEDALARAIFLILSTVKGQRRMRPNFGCGIHQFVFAPNNSTTIDLIQHEVIEALNWWEPRITVLDVNAHPDPDDDARLLIEVTYLIKATNDRRNLVFPFYFIPGEA